MYDGDMPLDDDARRRAAETKRTRTTTAIHEAFMRLVERTGGSPLFTMRDVAVEAGISESTLYRYYSDKSDVIEAIYPDDPEPAADLDTTVEYIVDTIRLRSVGVDWSALRAQWDEATEDVDYQEACEALVEALLRSAPR